MKRQIRRKVFETNSSSVHSLTMCNKDEYTRWENGEVLFWKDKDKFATKEDIIEELKRSTWYDGSLRFPNTNWENEDEIRDIFSDERIQTCEEFFDDEWYETFEQNYTTPNGDKVVAFGYYGHD